MAGSTPAHAVPPPEASSKGLVGRYGTIALAALTTARLRNVALLSTLGLSGAIRIRWSPLNVYHVWIAPQRGNGAIGNQTAEWS